MGGPELMALGFGFGGERGERETRGFAIHNQQRHQGMLGGVIETVLQNDPGGHTIGAWLPVGQ